MDADLADVFTFSSWPEIGKLSWSTNDGLPSSSGNLDTNCSFAGPQNSISSSKMDGCSLETLQNPGCHDQGMQVPWSQTYINAIGGLQQTHSEGSILASQFNNMLEVQSACNSVRPSQSQTDGLLQTLPPRLQETACNVLQRLSREPSRLPKLSRSPSISSSGSDLSSCQQISCGTSEPIALHHQNYSGVHYPSPFGLVQQSSQFFYVPEEAHHLRKRAWGDEGWLHPQQSIYNRLDQGHSRQVRPCQLPHSQSATDMSAVATRPRTRARRGQATDPHSIAERQRRERISDRIKRLQELVPNTNKTDKAQMLDEIIEYVKFLRLQVKVFSMSRLGATGAVAPLVSEGSSEGLNNFSTTMVHSNSSSADAGGDGNLSATEEEVAKMMEKDMSAALRYLQSKGLCLMPLSLATAISAKDSRQSRSFTCTPDT